MTGTMTFALSRLTLLDWLVVSVGLWVVIALEMAKPMAEPLDRRDQAFVDWGNDASGFGAFARGANGSFGWVAGRGNLQAAKEDALSYCAASGTRCRVEATYDVTEFNTLLNRHITPTMSRHFEIYLRKPGTRAFALSEDGSVGYWHSASSTHVATQKALRTCETYRTRKSRPAFLADRPCKIVHQIQ